VKVRKARRQRRTIAHRPERRRTTRCGRAPLEQINAVFDQMRAGAIDGRVVLKV
jgi:D-arabinose 1-dehydrogenase-like Zn-dependent alcohol dehydrogenase